MRCARCLQDSPASAKFCEHCGAALARACRACGHLLSAAAKYCGECGCADTPADLAEKILRSRAALEGERKQVTVLFADVKGSMELVADRDPEEARQLLDPVLALMMEAVHYYEGTVNQVMGDGIMALFGAPVAHEDHAVRACYAALRMQQHVGRHAEATRDALSGPLRIRIGLNSGEVVVRSIGSDLRMDYTAVGQTTHLAARMEQMAEPGAIFVTADTFRSVEGYVDASLVGRLPVRGLDPAVDVYTVTGTGRVRWRLDAAATRGLSAFVGRESELAQLARALQSAAEGRGQIVGIVGEPGVGKSRLFHEFTRSDATAGWLVLRSGAVSYGKAHVYGPFSDLLRTYFGIDDRMDPRTVRDRIARVVDGLDETLRVTVPALSSVLDVSGDDPDWHALDPRARRQRTMDAVKRLLLTQSREQPVCIVLEDLHWIDSESQALLDDLVESLPAARVLLLVNYRPEYRHGWGSKTYYVQLRVDPLPIPNAQQLLRTLIGADAALAPVAQVLIEQTQGNPFFLEECVRTLAEDGVLAGERGRYRLAKPVDTVRVPPTVEAVLAARVDRLAPQHKQLLQSAAVIGENVPVVLLRAVAGMSDEAFDEGLARLRAAEFLYDISAFPEPQYVFAHGLTRRVAYNSLLRDRRRTLHAQIVEAMERLYPEDRAGEHVERLAYHAMNGELWERAMRYLRRAGTKAFDRSANREAVALFGQALEVVARLPDNPVSQVEAIDLHLGLRNALTLLGEHERTLEHLRRAEALAERLGDRRRLGRALSFEVNSLLLLGQHDAAVECARRAGIVADELGDVRLKTVTAMYAGRAHLHRGDFARAIEHFGVVVGTLTGALAHDHLGVPVLPSVFARSHLVECLSEVGRFDESARYAEEAAALAATANHPDTLLWAHHGTGVHHLARGEVAPATQAFERAYAICRANDMPAYRPRVSSELGLAWALGGRALDAVPIVEQAAEEAASRRQVATYSRVLLLAAEVYLLAERLDAAAAAATSALEHSRRQHERGHEARALWLLGEIALRQGSTHGAEAERYLEESAALAERLGMRPLSARCQLGLARVFRRTGQAERARQAGELACARFRELGMRADLARAEAELPAVS